MKIGVISDTHNYFDPQIPGLFQGVEHILHGGDIGLPRILHQLEDIAPVTAVHGNTDDLGFGYNLTRSVQLNNRKFLLHHILNPHSPDVSMEQQIARDRPDIVIFGHTHKPFCETIRGALFFNPGYAGKSRFGMPRTMAILHLEQNAIRHEFLTL
jgi:putative phosphoesterase